jgi:putative addiction module CopG family antidote
MSTRTISLPDDLSKYLDDQVASGQFEDASECIRALLEARKLAELRKDVELKLLRAVQSPEDVMEAAEWDALQSQGDRILSERRGHP